MKPNNFETRIQEMEARRSEHRGKLQEAIAVQRAQCDIIATIDKEISISNILQIATLTRGLEEARGMIYLSDSRKEGEE